MKLAPGAIKMIPSLSIRKDCLIELDTEFPPGGSKEKESRGHPPGEKPEGPGAQKRGNPSDHFEKEGLYHARLDGLNLLP
jgi:hypothetical protein